MPEIGQNISHYSIVEKIGKGGMGEVFRAKDQKLGRDVAIKVLPEEFARDADRVARFQREAKLLASLNGSALGHLKSFLKIPIWALPWVQVRRGTFTLMARGF